MKERESTISAKGRILGAATTRRRFLGGTAVVGLAASFPLVLTPGKAKAADVLRFADDGGSTGEGRQKHYIVPFMKKTGIEVKTFVGQKDLAKMKAMARTGNLEWDIITDGGVPSLAAAKEGLLEKIDYSRLNMANFGVKEWAWPETVAWEYFSGGLAHNTDAIKEGGVPKTWAEFWDVKKFPGRRGLRTRPQEMLELGLMADGVPANKVYPIDVERGLKSLDKIKKDVAIWIEETAKTIEHLQRKEADFTYTYSGRVEVARKAGFPMAFNYDMPISTPQNIHIMKGTKVYDASMKLVDWFLNPEPGVPWFTEFLGYGPTDKVTMQRLSAEVKTKMPSLENPKALWTDVSWWGDNLAETEKRYKAWLLA